MDCKEGFVDVSCFFLWEGSADSEADHHTGPLIANNSSQIEIALEAEDAESCSAGTFSDHAFGACEALDSYCKDAQERQPSRCSSKVWLQSDAGSGYEEGEEEEEEEVESKMVCHVNNSMDEMEEDRLFWETCMAVGYPSSSP